MYNHFKSSVWQLHRISHEKSLHSMKTAKLALCLQPPTNKKHATLRSDGMKWKPGRRCYLLPGRGFWSLKNLLKLEAIFSSFAKSSPTGQRHKQLLHFLPVHIVGATRGEVVDWRVDLRRGSRCGWKNLGLVGALVQWRVELRLLQGLTVVRPGCVCWVARHLGSSKMIHQK